MIATLANNGKTIQLEQAKVSHSCQDQLGSVPVRQKAHSIPTPANAPKPTTVPAPILAHIATGLGAVIT